jgi:hypothetical protein
MPQGTQPPAADPDLARFEIAHFGAALLHGAEEEQADEQSARYKVHARFTEISAFYEAIYGTQKGMVVEVAHEPEMVTVAVGKSVEQADFSTLMVTPHPQGENNRYQVMIMPRGEVDPDEEAYPDSSPWADPA